MRQNWNESDAIFKETLLLRFYICTDTEDVKDAHFIRFFFSKIFLLASLFEIGKAFFCMQKAFSKLSYIRGKRRFFRKWLGVVNVRKTIINFRLFLFSRISIDNSVSIINDSFQERILRFKILIFYNCKTIIQIYINIFEKIYPVGEHIFIALFARKFERDLVVALRAPCFIFFTYKLLNFLDYKWKRKWNF